MWPATLRISSGGATASVTSSVPRRFDMVGMRTVLQVRAPNLPSCRSHVGCGVSEAPWRLMRHDAMQNHPPAGHTDAWWESASLDTLFHSPGAISWL